MTGLSETEHVVQGLAAGGVDYVTKPIVVEELLRAHPRAPGQCTQCAQASHAALDAAGRFLLATDRERTELKWCTPKARDCCSAICPAAAGPGRWRCRRMSWPAAGGCVDGSATRDASCMLEAAASPRRVHDAQPHRRPMNCCSA